MTAAKLYPNDPVAHTYYERRLSEMAMYKGPIDDAHSMMSKPDIRKNHYEEMKQYPIHKDYGDGLVTHVNTVGNVTEYRTVDDYSRELIHFSDFHTNNTSAHYPYPHTVQKAVEKFKDSRLPRGFVEDLAYTHFKNSATPMRSDDEQYEGGVHLWDRLVDRAIADGHHAYLYSHADRKHHPITADNKDELFPQYFGTGWIKRKDHLVISKEKLDE